MASVQCYFIIDDYKALHILDTIIILNIVAQERLSLGDVVYRNKAAIIVNERTRVLLVFSVYFVSQRIIYKMEGKGTGRAKERVDSLWVCFPWNFNKNLALSL